MLPEAAPDGIRVNTITLAFTLVAGTIVFLRLFTRFVLTKGAGFEDALIAIAMISSIGLAVVISEQVMHGLGNHTAGLEKGNVTSILKAFWASLWIYNLTLTVTKVSILVQYLRIFPIRRFQQACYVMLCIVLACGSWGIFGNVFMCYPVTSFWDMNHKGGRCMNQYIIWFTNAALNIGQDVIIILLPLPVIRSLRIPASQKKGLVTMLALGASVTAVSIIRLYTLDDIAQSKDIAFDNSDQATISAVEANVGIVCACIPAMRPLFALMMPKYFSPAALGNKEPAKDVERPEHIEQKRPQSLHKPAHAPRKSSVAPSSKHASNRGSLVSKVSLQSRPSTVIGPNSSKVSLLSPTPPAAIQKSRDLHSSRLPSSIPEARRSRSESRSVTHSRSVSTSQSRRGSHIAMASITYPARSISHSRSGSNLTVKTSRTHMSSHGSRLPPMAPSEPSLAHGLSRPSESDTISLLAPSAYSRRPSDSSLYMTRTPSWQPQTSIKPLPVTPFPVGLDKYTPLENEEESER